MYESYNEIFKQDEILRKTYDYVISKKGIVAEFFKNNEYEEVVFVGCGSSYWLSTSACMTFQEKTGVKASAVTSGDIVMNMEYYKKAYKNPLVVAPSRSGSTTETLQVLKMFKETYSSRVITVVEYENSPIEGLSDVVLRIPWANEISVCQTRSFSNLYLACVMLGAIAGKDEGLLKDLDQYLNEAEGIMRKGEELLRKIIKEFPKCRALVTLGSGKQLGVAFEGAYICIEMTQFPSNYYATLELRHGPIVMLDEGYLVGIFSGTNARELEESMAQDSLNKGAKVASISAEDDFNNASYKFTLGRKACPETVALYGIFVMQGFAHLKAVDMGIDPDNPKELIPWIKI